MAEDLNIQALNQLVRLLMQTLTGTNAFNVPGSAFTPGSSIQHIIGSYQRSQDQYKFRSPISNSIHEEIGGRIYESTMRLLGFSSADIAKFKNSAGSSFMQKAIAFGSDIYMGRAVDAFANTAYRRLYANQSSNINAFRDSFTAAGKGIIQAIGDGSLQGYSIQDAFKVASLFTRQGRYDFTANNERAAKLKKDLQDYAEGINNLRDGLQGSLEQVLDSFEKLTGSSATVMHKDRFTALSRSLYNATAIGGVTPQLLQSAIATQHAYLQGTGATQATSMALGTINANILANGVSVEGASQNAMNEALTRQSARWMTTGKAKELTAAYGWWADKHGKERNAETFEEFRASMGGNLSDVAVRRYLEQNNVSGAYINSARNRRNMAAPYIYNAFHEQNVSDYEKAFRRFQRRTGNILSDTDLWLTDDELTDKLMEDARKNNNGNPLSKRQIDRITRIVEDRRNIIRGITQTTDADNGLNILRNQRQAVVQQRQAKASNLLLQGLAGDDISIGGLAGVLQTMIKDKGVAKDTIGELLGSILGVNIDVKDLKSMDENNLKAVLGKALGTTDEKEIEKALKFATKDVQKMSGAERSMLFDLNKDKRTVNAKDGKPLKDKNGKDIVWGDIRKNLLKLRRDGDIKGYTEALKKAQEQGFISEEEAFVASYSAEHNVDFVNSPEAVKTAERIYKTYKQAKDMGVKDTRQFASAVERIRGGVTKAGDEDFVKQQLKDSKEFAKYRKAVEDAQKAVKGADDTAGMNAYEKAKQAFETAVNTKYDALAEKGGTSPDYWFEEILNEIKKIASNMLVGG